MRVADLDAAETLGLYHEIFVNDSYLQHGLSVESGDVVFDVGANIGLFAVRLASAWPGVSVQMFEPVPSTRAVLETNVREHHVSGKVFGCALSESDGEAELTCYPRMSLMSGLHADPREDASLLQSYLANVVRDSKTLAERSARVPARFQNPIHTRVALRSLSSIVEQESIARIDLLKIDTEKSEHQVLAGLREEHWHLVRQIVVEVHDQDGRLAQLSEGLRRRGFVVVADQQSEWAGTAIWMLYARRSQ